MKFFAQVLALSLFVLSTAYAQTPTQSEKFAALISPLSDKLAQSNRTLLDMSSGIPPESGDQNAIFSISENLMIASEVLDRVSDLALIHSLMQSPKDQITVKKFLNSTTKYAVKVNERTLKITNRESVRIKSSAAAAEVQKVRETLQVIGKEMQQFVAAQ